MTDRLTIAAQILAAHGPIAETDPTVGDTATRLAGYALAYADALLAAAEKPAEQMDGPIGIALGGALMFPPGGAEKPAEAAPVVTGGIQFDPEGHAISPTTGKTTHVDPDGWFGFANKERAGVYVKASGLESARRAVRAMRDAGIAAVRGEAAPVASAWCPQCGPQLTADEDGCCESCGATATGEGADKALTAIHTLLATTPAPVPSAAGETPALPWVVRWVASKKEIARCEVAFDAKTLCDLYGTSAVEVVRAAAPTVAAVNFEGGRAGGSEWLAATHSEEPFRFVTVRLDLRPGEDAGVTTATILAACGRGL